MQSDLNKSLSFLLCLILVILSTVWLTPLGKTDISFLSLLSEKICRLFLGAKILFVRGARTFFSSVMFNVLQTCLMSGNVQECFVTFGNVRKYPVMFEGLAFGNARALWRAKWIEKMLWSTIGHNEHNAQHLQHNGAQCTTSWAQSSTMSTMHKNILSTMSTMHSIFSTIGHDAGIQPSRGTSNLDLLGKSFHVEIYPSSWESPWSARIIKEFWFFIIHSGLLITVLHWYPTRTLSILS